MASQSEFDTVKELEQKLESAHSDLKLVRSLFRDHVQSGFVSRFVESELYNIKDNPDHLVRRNAGQVSFTLINTVDFDYTIKLVPPFAGRPHAVKWLGEQQILSVQGEGGALVRRLTVPHDINDFLAGLLIEEIEMVYLNEREFLESPSPNNILDIYEIKEPVVFEVLTIHNQTVELHWTFDEGLRSVFAESSRMTSSRLQNVLDLAVKMGKRIPDTVYHTIFSQGSTQAKILAIESLLITDSISGFRELYEAIDSTDAALSMGAQRLLDSLTAQT